MMAIPGKQHWPIVRTHEQAQCFRQDCQKPIGKSPGTESGFAVSHGAYVAWCPECKCKTWYDITSEVKGE